MRISLEIISERLKKQGFSVVKEKLSSAFLLDQARFFVENTEFDSNILYICSAHNDLRPGRCKNASLLCIGDFPGTEKAAAFLVFDEGTDAFRLSNAVNEIFRQFQTWEDVLKDPIQKQLSMTDNLQALVDASSDILENGITIMDLSLNFLAISDITLQYGGYDTISNMSDHKRVSPDVMSLLRDDPGYQNVQTSLDIVIMDDSILPYRTMNKNLYVNQSVAGRITITGCVRDFLDSDKTLLLMLSSTIEKILASFQLDSSAYNRNLASLFEDMLSSNTVNKRALDSELEKIGWNSKGQFVLLLLSSIGSDSENIETLYYCREIMRNIPESYVFQTGQYIVAVLNELSPDRSIYDMMQSFTIFIREANFRVGISNRFEDIYTMSTYFRQAEIALDIGLKNHPTEWLHYFSNYILEYAFSMATVDFSEEELLSPIYFRLKKYDEENDTALVQTLSIYLENHMNVVRSAKALFIHRSTMLYRLQRICEIGGTHLTDEKELLHLVLTFYLLKQQRIYKEGLSR